MLFDLILIGFILSIYLTCFTSKQFKSFFLMRKSLIVFYEYKICLPSNIEM